MPGWIWEYSFMGKLRHKKGCVELGKIAERKRSNFCLYLTANFLPITSLIKVFILLT
jgi:hypothetical protein